jgi:hypothetical protein
LIEAGTIASTDATGLTVELVVDDVDDDVPDEPDAPEGGARLAFVLVVLLVLLPQPAITAAHTAVSANRDQAPRGMLIGLLLQKLDDPSSTQHMRETGCCSNL